MASKPKKTQVNSLFMWMKLEDMASTMQTALLGLLDYRLQAMK